MHFTSLELSQQLYEVSKWKSDWMYWKRLVDGYDKARVLLYGAVTTRDGAMICPAYDLGFLLRKLPNSTDLDADQWYEKFDCGVPDAFFLAYEMDTMRHKWRVQMQIEDGVLEATIFDDDTPENALIRLFIELFRLKILVK